MKKVLITILGIILFFNLFLLCPLGREAKAAILCVDKKGQSFDPNCKACYKSIMYAVFIAKAGDVIIVNKGVYEENIDFSGKAITIKSVNADDPNCIKETKIIGAGVKSPVVCFVNNEGNASVLSGLSITNRTGANNGGGIFCRRSSPVVKKCMINENVSDLYGGGIYLEQFSKPRLIECSFISNSSEKGGGIYADTNSSPFINQCIIEKNSAISEGGGMYLNSSMVEVSESQIMKNSAQTGAGIYLINSSNSVIAKSTIQMNRATGDGGGVYCSNSTVNLERCTVSQNTAFNQGGGIYLYTSCHSHVINCLIIENTAMSYGGGGICSYANNMTTITNSTFSRNMSKIGGGVYSDGSSWDYSINITNCIFWDDYPNEIIPGGYWKINYSNIMGEYYNSQGNISVDPLFINSKEGDYYIVHSSPCVDAGDPNLATSDDLIGVRRPQGAVIDMGAYENVNPTFCISRPVFTVSPDSGTAPLAVEFDANYSGGAMCSSAEFFWDFSDKTKGEGINVTHTFTEYGVYAVCLTQKIDQDTNTIQRTTRKIYVFSNPPTRQVGKGGNYEYESIQKAIDEAGEYESIVVNDGIYYERIDFKGKSIMLISKGGPETTIIDGGGNGSVVQFINFEGRNSVIDGFTIQSGSAPKGGGIYCELASPTIRNCIIKVNYSSESGGGIYCTGAFPMIQNCKISNNSTGFDGGGIYAHLSL